MRDSMLYKTYDISTFHQGRMDVRWHCVQARHGNVQAFASTLPSYAALILLRQWACLDRRQFSRGLNNHIAPNHIPRPCNPSSAQVWFTYLLDFSYLAWCLDISVAMKGYCLVDSCRVEDLRSLRNEYALQHLHLVELVQALNYFWCALVCSSIGAHTFLMNEWAIWANSQNLLSVCLMSLNLYLLQSSARLISCMLHNSACNWFTSFRRVEHTHGRTWVREALP
jgi:hypothetical protein